MYLFDTDTVSNLIKPVPSTALVAKIADVPRARQCISSITVGELIFGAYKAVARTESLLEQIDTYLLKEISIIPFDELAARRYGQVRAFLELQGTPLQGADLRIASIALSRNLTIVTGNTRHFRRVPGLRAENWM